MIEIRLSEPVRRAREEGRPIVALESTVYSTLGLPVPHNREALDRCCAAVESAGAVPAVTAVLDGQPVAGLTEDEVDRILASENKTAERDLPVAIAQRWETGVTTVSAALAIAESAAIPVFATGGIGGVHREVLDTGDISADLGAIARRRVVTISAGAKSFLDLPRTLEALETLGTPVVGWQTDEFPAFTARSSGIPLAHRFDEIERLAELAQAQVDGFGRGLLVVTPVPESAALDQAVHDQALESALQHVADAGLRGAAVTPYVLEHIAAASGGRSVPANLALVENNSVLAGRLAAALAG